MHYCEEIFDRTTKDLLWDHLRHLSSISSQTAANASCDLLVDPYYCLLRWYHNHALCEIFSRLQKEDEDRLQECGVDFDFHRRQAADWQVNAEKAMRLFDKGRLTNEQLTSNVAYLCLLSEEIGIKREPLATQSQSCLQIVRHIVEHRGETKTFEGGRANVIRWSSKSMRSSKPRPGPWELTCLPHHMAVALSVGDVERSMEETKLFMLSDYTFSKSWDPSWSDLAGGWWDFEVTSIICAKMLDDFQPKKISKTATKDPQDEQIGSKSLIQQQRVGSTINLTASSESESNLNTSVQPPPEERQESMEVLMKSMAKMLKQKILGVEYTSRFDWMITRPEGLFHPDAVVQSLEDTPKVFKIKQLRNTRIRNNVQRYLSREKMPEMDWSIENVSGRIPPAQLRHISCFDFALVSDGTKRPEIRISSACGGVPHQHGATDKPGIVAKLGNLIADMSEDDQLQLQNMFKGINERDQGMWDLFYLGIADEYPRFQYYPKSLRDRLCGEGGLRHRLLNQYQKSLFSVLNDSVSNRTSCRYIRIQCTNIFLTQFVDLGTKYRVL